MARRRTDNQLRLGRALGKWCGRNERQCGRPASRAHRLPSSPNERRARTKENRREERGQRNQSACGRHAKGAISLLFLLLDARLSHFGRSPNFGQPVPSAPCLQREKVRPTISIDRAQHFAWSSTLRLRTKRLPFSGGQTLAEGEGGAEVARPELSPVGLSALQLMQSSRLCGPNAF